MTDKELLCDTNRAKWEVEPKGTESPVQWGAVGNVAGPPRGRCGAGVLPARTCGEEGPGHSGRQMPAACEVTAVSTLS